MKKDGERSAEPVLSSGFQARLHCFSVVGRSRTVLHPYSQGILPKHRGRGGQGESQGESRKTFPHVVSDPHAENRLLAGHIFSGHGAIGAAENIAEIRQFRPVLHEQNGNAVLRIFGFIPSVPVRIDKGSVKFTCSSAVRD